MDHSSRPGIRRNPAPPWAPSITESKQPRGTTGGQHHGINIKVKAMRIALKVFLTCCASREIPVMLNINCSVTLKL